MDRFDREIARRSSIPLDGGGDTHFHLHGPDSRFTVTTRLPEGLAFHDTFGFQEGELTLEQRHFRGELIP